MAGTVHKLVQRLTFHRVIGMLTPSSANTAKYNNEKYPADSEFNEAFMLTFYSFMTPAELLKSLQER